MPRLLATTVALTALLAAVASADPGPEAALPGSAVAVRPPPSPPPAIELLATGDSMMLYVADGLAEELSPEPAVRLRRDARSATGITKSFLLSWPRHARWQAERHRPDATVVFLGASDGYPLLTRSGARTPCCGAAWGREYARRARLMMETYSRGGSSYVYWLLLPRARPSLSLGRTAIGRARVFPAVNRAIRLAARPMGDTVRLVRLDEVFTPRGRYSDTIVWAGRRVTARARDGIHLSRQGAAIAASLVVDRMRSDGLLID